MRKFVAFSECSGKSKMLGDGLLEYVKLMFDYWHQLKAGQRSRERFQQLMTPIRVEVERLLQKGRVIPMLGSAWTRAKTRSGSAAIFASGRRVLRFCGTRRDVLTRVAGRGACDANALHDGNQCVTLCIEVGPEQ